MPKSAWRVKSGITAKAKALGKKINQSSLITQVLLNRGLDDEQKIFKFLNPNISDLPDPFLLTDIQKAGDRIVEAIKKKQRICIYGDYDIDGTTAIFLLVDFLKAVGAIVSHYQPTRFDDGYGLHISCIKEIQNSGIDLIITVDCGSSNFDTAEYCKKNSIDLIITDHHKVSESFPNAYAFVNPHRELLESTNCLGFKNLAGVGVAYYLVIVVRKILREQGFFKDLNLIPNLKNYMDIVAFGTVADVVPLSGINRLLVKNGLELLNSSKRPAFKALYELSGLKTDINAHSIGYVLAPRMNAASRLGEAKKVINLLFSNNPEQAMGVAKDLEADNNKRVSLQNKAWEDVQQKVADYISKEGLKNFENKRTLSFADKSWHQGILGIVAAKSVEKWNKPSIIFNISESGIAKGSVRSLNKLDIHSLLSFYKENYISFGGHSMAAGLSLKSEKLPEFEKFFESKATELTDLEFLKPHIDVDVEVEPNDLSAKTVEEINQLEPFGSENPSPLFMCSGLKITNKTILKEKHLKLKLSNGVEAIAFNMASVADKLGEKVDMVFKPTINEWNGNKKLQYQVFDID